MIELPSDERLRDVEDDAWDQAQQNCLGDHERVSAAGRRALVNLGVKLGVEWATKRLNAWADGYEEQGDALEGAAFDLAANDLRREAGLPEVDYSEEER